MTPIHPEFANTEWANPTKDKVTIRLHIDAGVEPLVVEIPPGQTAMIGAKFDGAIQRVKDGVVVGGYAPQLVRKGTEPMPIHQAIAHAARLGQEERSATRATGVSGGARHLDMGMMLQSQIDEMRADMGSRLSMSAAEAETAKRAAAEESAKRIAAEAKVEAARSEAEATARSKDAELDRLRRQLEELQTAPEKPRKSGGTTG